MAFVVKSGLLPADGFHFPQVFSSPPPSRVFSGFSGFGFWCVFYGPRTFDPSSFPFRAFCEPNRDPHAQGPLLSFSSTFLRTFCIRAPPRGVSAPLFVSRRLLDMGFCPFWKPVTALKAGELVDRPPPPPPATPDFFFFLPVLFSFSTT